MNEAPLYSRSNVLQRREAAYVLKKYGKLVRWNRDDGQERVLDIGCGDGNVTVEILLPFLPDSVRKVVGLDVSEEMVRYAKKYHSSDRVKFVRADISGKDAVEDVDEEYDHIFSFFCLHWVQNQRKCAENLYELLKPNGDILLTFLVTNPIYDIYESLAKYPKWSEYMWDVEKYISPYHHCADPEGSLTKVLRGAGFHVTTCKVIDRVFVFTDVVLWKKAVTAVSPFLARVPEHLRKEYEEDFFEEVKQLNCVVKNENNNEDNVVARYKLFVVHAYK